VRSASFPFAAAIGELQRPVFEILEITTLEGEETAHCAEER
jgi:hypothetical protein